MDVGSRQAGGMRAAELDRLHTVQFHSRQDLAGCLAEKHSLVAELGQDAQTVAEILAALADDDVRIRGQRMGVDSGDEQRRELRVGRGNRCRTAADAVRSTAPTREASRGWCRHPGLPARWLGGGRIASASSPESSTTIAWRTRLSPRRMATTRPAPGEVKRISGRLRSTRASARPRPCRLPPRQDAA